MERVELAVFSQATNAAVVQVPGRRFPGIVIQGDTLFNLVAAAEGIVAELRAGERPIDDAADLADRLRGFLKHYGRTLGEHGLPLPYFQPEA